MTRYHYQYRGCSTVPFVFSLVQPSHIQHHYTYVEKVKGQERAPDECVTCLQRSGCWRVGVERLGTLIAMTAMRPAIKEQQHVEQPASLQQTRLHRCTIRGETDNDATQKDTDAGQKGTTVTATSQETRRAGKMKRGVAPKQKKEKQNQKDRQNERKNRPPHRRSRAFTAGLAVLNQRAQETHRGSSTLLGGMRRQEHREREERQRERGQWQSSR